MDHFHGVGSSIISKEEPIIRDIIIDSSSEDEDPDVMDMEDDVLANMIHPYQSNTTTTTNMEHELDEHMCFSSKDSAIFAIKQFHIQQGYKFMVVESKTNIYVSNAFTIATVVNGDFKYLILKLETNGRSNELKRLTLVCQL